MKAAGARSGVPGTVGTRTPRPVQAGAEGPAACQDRLRQAAVSAAVARQLDSPRKACGAGRVAVPPSGAARTVELMSDAQLAEFGARWLDGRAYTDRECHGILAALAAPPAPSRPLEDSLAAAGFSATRKASQVYDPAKSVLVALCVAQTATGARGASDGAGGS